MTEELHKHMCCGQLMRQDKRRRTHENKGYSMRFRNICKICGLWYDTNRKQFVNQLVINQLAINSREPVGIPYF